MIGLHEGEIIEKILQRMYFIFLQQLLLLYFIQNSLCYVLISTRLNMVKGPKVVAQRPNEPVNEGLNQIRLNPIQQFEIVVKFF